MRTKESGIRVAVLGGALSILAISCAALAQDDPVDSSIKSLTSPRGYSKTLDKTLDSIDSTKKSLDKAGQKSSEAVGSAKKKLDDAMGWNQVHTGHEVDCNGSPDEYMGENALDSEDSYYSQWWERCGKQVKARSQTLQDYYNSTQQTPTPSPQSICGDTRGASLEQVMQCQQKMAAEQAKIDAARAAYQAQEQARREAEAAAQAQAAQGSGGNDGVLDFLIGAAVNVIGAKAALPAKVSPAVGGSRIGCAVSGSAVVNGAVTPAAANCLDHP
jgi:hypothetical protein